MSLVHPSSSLYVTLFIISTTDACLVRWYIRRLYNGRMLLLISISATVIAVLAPSRIGNTGTTRTSAAVAMLYRGGVQSLEVSLERYVDGINATAGSCSKTNMSRISRRKPRFDPP